MAVPNQRSADLFMAAIWTWRDLQFWQEKRTREAIRDVLEDFLAAMKQDRYYYGRILIDCFKQEVVRLDGEKDTKSVHEIMADIHHRNWNILYQISERIQPTVN